MELHQLRYFCAIAAAVCGWLKRKAIGAFLGGLWSRATKWFWGYVHQRLKTVDKPDPSTPPAAPTNERTYRGRFLRVFHYGHLHEGFFEIENNGRFTKVPIRETSLLSGVNRGALVEIDTQVEPYPRLRSRIACACLRLNLFDGRNGAPLGSRSAVGPMDPTVVPHPSMIHARSVIESVPQISRSPF